MRTLYKLCVSDVILHNASIIHSDLKNKIFNN